MAPLIHIFALFALSTIVLASPHVSRNVYNHAHRAIAQPVIEIDSPASPALPKRKRSLNKRCIPNPSNSTTSSQPTSTAPINVAPVPSLPTSSSSRPTSSYVPPPPTTSQADTTSNPPAPTTPSTPPPAPTTSSTPPPAQTSSSSSSSGEPSYMTGTQTGQGTYYSTGLGACGITNNDSQYIAAVSELLFDTFPGYSGADPNTNPVCNKQVKASYQGKAVTVTITDRCTACAITDLDFSPAAFNTLADASLGRIDISWVWV